MDDEKMMDAEGGEGDDAEVPAEADDEQITSGEGE